MEEGGEGKQLCVCTKRGGREWGRGLRMKSEKYCTCETCEQQNGTWGRGRGKQETWGKKVERKQVDNDRFQ